MDTNLYSLNSAIAKFNIQPKPLTDKALPIIRDSFILISVLFTFLHNYLNKILF